MKSAEVIIIGGGVIGVSCAYHLALKGCKNIVVIDRGNKPGEGSTGRATGGFRCQFATGVNVKLSLLSRTKILLFKEELDTDPGYLPYGYLFIASNDKELRRLREALEVQREAGLTEAYEVSRDDIHRLSPAVSMDGITGGTFCGSDGFINPMNILQGYKQGAEHLGVRFEFGVECLGFKTTKGQGDNSKKILEVNTSDGKTSVNKAVNASGAWAGVLAHLAGIDIPVSPVCRQVAVFKELNLLTETNPMTIFIKDGFHFRVRDGHIILLLPEDVPSSDRFAINVNNEWIEKVRSIAYERVPCLAGKEIDRGMCWAGLYEMTPDKHALLGNAPGFENFYLVNGSSGHGVMHSPALGQLLSEIILDGTAKTIDVQSLRASRFGEGKANAVTDIF